MASLDGVTPSEEKDLPVTELLARLSTTESGLSSSEAVKRLQQYGPNDIVEKKRSAILAVLLYFWGPIPWMIEAAAVISAFLQNWDDLVIITALLVVNVIVRSWQENKASNAIELLKQKLALRAKVLRDGKWADLPARELVPGDIARAGSRLIALACMMRRGRNTWRDFEQAGGGVGINQRMVSL